MVRHGGGAAGQGTSLVRSVQVLLFLGTGPILPFLLSCAIFLCDFILLFIFLLQERRGCTRSFSLSLFLSLYCCSVLSYDGEVFFRSDAPDVFDEMSIR